MLKILLKPIKSGLSKSLQKDVEFDSIEIMNKRNFIRKMVVPVVMKPKRKLKVIEVKLGREKAVGMADYENFNILLDPRQKPYEYLNTMIHELIHHMSPSWDETRVNWWANRISRFLWSHNYRQVKQ